MPYLFVFQNLIKSSMENSMKNVVLLLLLLSHTVFAYADFSGCMDQFYAGNTPKINNAALKKNLYPLCFNGFAVAYSGVSRTPLWSAEHLTPQRLKQAKSISRENNFHEEDQIPARYRSRLSDYSRSGYDRGHMAPNGDMANRAQQFDSFSLANMVPQSPKNNQEVWRNLEEATRTLVTRHKQSAYVVTGPAFLSGELKQVGQVLVPTHVFKAVYFPQLNLAGAYFAPNDQSGQVDVVSIKELEQTLGINIFPSMSAPLKAKRTLLPLNSNQASKANQSWGTGTTKVKPAVGAQSNGSGDHASKAEHSNADWIAQIKHQLVELLVGFLRSR